MPSSDREPRSAELVWDHLEVLDGAKCFSVPGQKDAIRRLAGAASRGAEARMDCDTGRLRLFPLNTVLFPGAALHLHIFEPRYREMVAECLASGDAFGVVLIRDGDEAGDPNVTPHLVGTTAEIDEVTQLDGGRYYLSTIGRRRFQIENIVAREPYLLVDVTYLPDDAPAALSVEQSLLREIRAVFRDYLRLLLEFSGTHAEIDLPDDPIEASYLIGDALQVADTMKQRLLELPSTEQRLGAELAFLRRLLPQLRALLKRKQKAPPSSRAAAPVGGTFRVEQEKFFGKHFSQN